MNTNKTLHDQQHGRKFNAWEHLVDTYETLGAWKGMLGLTVVMAIFYAFVIYMISRRHKNIEEIKKAQMLKKK